MKSDAELMLAFRDGEEAGFEELVQRHRTPLINFCYRIVWDRDLAEDVVQEVFVRIHRHRADYEPRAKFTTYLYRIARNCSVDYLRKSRHQRKDRSLDAEDEDGRSLYDNVDQRAENPAAGANKEEFADSVIEAIQSLPEEHRIVFILSEVEDMKYAEISEVLDVPVGTIKSRMHNATKKLREKLIHLRPYRAPQADAEQGTR